MPIIYHEKERIFHLYNNKVSYIINILKNGQIGNLYYGAKIKDNNFEHLFELLTRCQATCTYEEDSCFSLEHIKQEYPTYGSGDMREPALDIVQKKWQ